MSTQRATGVGAGSSASTKEMLKRVGKDVAARGGVIEELRFKLDGHVWASNLFSVRKHGKSEHLLTALCRSAQLAFFASGADLRTVWEEYHTASEEQVAVDPFAAFSPPKGSQKYEVGKAYSLTSMILAKDRPRPITDALISFPSMRIYFIHNTTALIQESEAIAGTEKVFKDATFTFIKENNHLFTGFVEFQQGRTDLKDGQRVRLTFQETGFRCGCVVKLAKESVSAAPSGYIVRMVRSDSDYVEDDSDSDSGYGTQSGTRVAWRPDDLEATHLVEMSLDYLDVDTRRQLDGLVTMRDSATIYSAAHALLRANNLRSIPRMDFYHRIPGSAAEKDAFLAEFLECLPLAFNSRQKEAFHALRSMPYAHMVQGPGGTGKSEFATLACQPLLLTSPSSGPKNQVLIVCGSNINVDDLADQALEHSRRFLIALREPVVVRLHAYDTEIAVSTDNAAWKKVLSSDRSKIDPVVLARMKKKRIDDIEEQLAEPTEDHRLQLKHQSLGWYMRRVIGVGALGADDPLYIPDKFCALSNTYRSWADPDIPFPSRVKSRTCFPSCSITY